MNSEPEIRKKRKWRLWIMIIVLALLAIYVAMVYPVARAVHDLRQQQKAGR